MAGHARKLCIFLSCSSRVQFLAAHRNSFCNCAVFKSAATLTALKLKQFEAPPGSNMLKLGQFKLESEVQSLPWTEPLQLQDSGCSRILELLWAISNATWLCHARIGSYEDSTGPQTQSEKRWCQNNAKEALGSIAFFGSFLSKMRQTSLYCSTYTEVLVGCAVFERWSARNVSSVADTIQLFQSCK